jgi:hypothetical protein
VSGGEESAARKQDRPVSRVTGLFMPFRFKRIHQDSGFPCVRRSFPDEEKPFFL